MFKFLHQAKNGNLIFLWDIEVPFLAFLSAIIFFWNQIFYLVDISSDSAPSPLELKADAQKANSVNSGRSCRWKRVVGERTWAD